jgi:hypothetical protein
MPLYIANYNDDIDYTQFVKSFLETEKSICVIYHENKFFEIMKKIIFHKDFAFPFYLKKESLQDFHYQEPLNQKNNLRIFYNDKCESVFFNNTFKNKLIGKSYIKYIFIDDVDLFIKGQFNNINFASFISLVDEHSIKQETNIPQFETEEDIKYRTEKAIKFINELKEL